MEHHVAGFVAYEVLVVRRQQMHTAAAEAADTAVLMREEIHLFPALADEFGPQFIHSLPAVIETQAAPPGKVL